MATTGNETTVKQPGPEAQTEFLPTSRVKFRTADVIIQPYHIIATFYDGTVSDYFWRGAYHPEYTKEYGYGKDWERYVIEHELAHHFIADNLGFRYSWAVYAGAKQGGPTPPETWPNHIAWEENIVNAFQAYAKCGQKDKWGVLQCVFPERKLEQKVVEFKELCRKALDEQKEVFYNHETGHIGKSYNAGNY